MAILDDGVVRAFGPPRSLYERPENIFVAEFFGRPPMNLIRGELKQDRGVARFHESGSGTIQFALPNSMNFALEQGNQIVVGIRPQDIEIAASAAASDGSAFLKFRAIAESVLPGGGGTEIRFHTGAHAGVCRSADWLDRTEVRPPDGIHGSSGKSPLFRPKFGRTTKCVGSGLISLPRPTCRA